MHPANTSNAIGSDASYFAAIRTLRNGTTPEDRTAALAALVRLSFWAKKPSIKAQAIAELAGEGFLVEDGCLRLAWDLARDQVANDEE